jgi:sterol desaturase/sphingolipid hydroxylase (fatty acid hydroxylase superfamily)
MRHDGFNLAIGVANGILITLLFASLWAVTSSWAESTSFGLFNIVELPVWVHWIGVFLLLDVWMYVWHRINHTIPFLWRFHTFHHSDTQMDVTTASRFHVVEIVLSSVLRVPVIALLGVSLEELVMYEAVMFAVVQFHHADIGLPTKLDSMLSWVIVTPNLHKVHHSAWQPETDSNYGSLFSFWDRLFRSKRMREDLDKIRFGVGLKSHLGKKND